MYLNNIMIGNTNGKCIDSFLHSSTFCTVLSMGSSGYRILPQVASSLSTMLTYTNVQYMQMDIFPAFLTNKLPFPRSNLTIQFLFDHVDIFKCLPSFSQKGV